MVGLALLLIGFVLGSVVEYTLVSTIFTRTQIDPSADVAALEFWALIVGVATVVCLVVGGLMESDDPAREVRRIRRAVVRAPGRLVGHVTDRLAWLRAEDRPALGTRKTLYFGALGALGATAGWFAWVAVAVLVAKWAEVWVSAVVGGVLGLVLEGTRRYRDAARARTEPETPRGRTLAVLVPMGSAAGIFVAVAGENSLAELIKEVRFPFLLSVMTFFVGGITVLVVSSLVARLELFRGVALFVLGWIVAPLPLLALNWLTGAGTEHGAIAAWWVLITLVAGLAVMRSKRAVWLAVLAAAIAAVIVVPLMLLAGLWPLELEAATTGRQLRPVMYAAVDLVEGLLAAPDVPAQAWSAAQRQLRSDGSIPLIEPRIPPGPSRWLADIGRCADIPAVPDADNPARYLDRKRELCRQIIAATGSGWTRSLIVVGFFCAGLTIADRLERRWRPDDYPNHPVRRYDRAALIAALTGLIVVITIIRWSGAAA
jgi:hypothetical protein